MGTDQNAARVVLHHVDDVVMPVRMEVESVHHAAGHRHFVYQHLADGVVAAVNAQNASQLAFAHPLAVEGIERTTGLPRKKEEVGHHKMQESIGESQPQILHEEDEEPITQRGTAAFSAPV